ncbi:hypothetical protein [Hymenobacter sp. IS2118]|uniref:hypothetical protein n=1 Tax=Hymenobacter sp. IS2118 TaxID=1505605 RepID=UPI00054D9AB3|nr:hypothetical protein [Hymenobacter sp. IS2118]
MMSFRLAYRSKFGRFRPGFLVIILFWNLLLLGQASFANPIRAVEVRMQDLPAIQLRHGTDSVSRLVNGTPIWRINRDVALALLQGTSLRFSEPGTWERRYLLRMGKEVKAAALVPLLEGALRAELEQAEQVNQRTDFVLSLDEDLLKAYLYQQPPTAEAVLKEQLNRYFRLRQQLEEGGQTGFFLRLLGQDLVAWSKASVEETIYKYLLALNRINPIAFPQTLVEEQQRRVQPQHQAAIANTFRQKESVKKQTEQVALDEVEVGGVTMPKSLGGTEGCSLIKITESEQVYFLEKSCRSSSKSGSGDTHLVKISHDKVELTLVQWWIS